MTQMYLSVNRNRLTGIDNRLAVTKEGRVGEGWVGMQSNITEWINNKVLLYGTRNYIHYPVSNHNGKEYEKECTYV